MQDTWDRQSVLTVVETTITPYIGRTMAQASTKVHCEKLGILSEKMTREQIRALLDRLGKAMLVFVGKGKADLITEEIETNIGLGG